MTDNSATLETAGYSNYPVNHLPLRIETGPDSLRLTWDDGHESEFHYLWLRDNCPCPSCVSTLTREQMFEICDVPLSIRPVEAQLDGGYLHIQWDDDGHVSRFHPGWLRSHCYSEQAREARQWQPDIWDRATIETSLPTYDYTTMMQDDDVLLSWLRQLRDAGISLLQNTDTTPGTLQQVAARISFIRETNFGTLFDVRSKPDANTAAYTNLRLPLHTDLPTRELQPGLQFLHCLNNDATGGESILVDGFRIAQHMREEYPDDFKALSSLPMDFYNKDRNSDYRFRGPALVLDGQGTVVEVRFANFLRGPLDVPADQVVRHYRAYRTFISLTREPRFQFEYRLLPGDLLVFDNRRVLHARQAFDLQQGHRHLQGCYVDRDELLSRIRVLERTL
ncbi:gamma-butyrobetaine dioxygenase [Oceanisphaera arctica]|uniref:Gamma-butyrobetaine hydroxylase n=1 Tax=Oceanisphaera arctica TaxID=641510 RepID=A0A2P5TKY0_9GAMM|nr:gamma-butyrobetaine dioxygenase [Oceanisphaera arctica]PPL15832.1 gamma-butyrobetaine hydroxylase [Oceanisphaera arctica]GHA10633.1 gamma-butyrobetaine hydroxylase [Oceanisphaera arctica]